MTVTETAIIGAVAAIIPSIVISVIGYMLKQRWESVDTGIKDVKTEIKADITEVRQDLKEHHAQSVSVHETQWKAINQTAVKVARLEGKS